jgi:sulfotransferase family protein
MASESSSSARPQVRREFSSLPDFFAVGPPRTATTWLHRVLQDRVNLPRTVKETRFFDLRYYKGLDWYQRHFAPAAEGLPFGEIAPTYFYSHAARQRIASLIPHARIICSLRDPVTRLYSLYKLKRAEGTLSCSFEDALERDFEMVESNRYESHLREWMKSFGTNKVLVLIYEELILDPFSYLERVCRFLGIPRFEIDESLLAPENASERLLHRRLPGWTQLGVRTADSLRANGYSRVMSMIRKLHLRKLFLSDKLAPAPPLDPLFADQLRRQFLPEVESLEALLKADLPVWKPRKT